jgi:hypothetical protein
MTSLTGNMGLGPTGKSGTKLPSGYRQGQIQQFTPQQMQLHGQLFGHVSPQSYLSKLAGGDEAAFQQMEAPALRDFNALQGNIASRFSGIGGGGNQASLGGRHSSGFQNTLTAAGSNFAQDLASRRHDLQRQAIYDLMGLSNTLLSQQPYDTFAYKKQKKKGFDWGGLLGGLAGGIGGAFLGNPFGGAALGYNVGSSFSGGSGLAGGSGGLDLSGFGGFSNPFGGSSGLNPQFQWSP